MKLYTPLSQSGFKANNNCTQLVCLALATCLFLLLSFPSCGQVPQRVKEWFPKETVFHHNIPYAGDTLKKHLLDIYMPSNAKANIPLVVWVHGGALDDE